MISLNGAPRGFPNLHQGIMLGFWQIDHHAVFRGSGAGAVLLRAVPNNENQHQFRRRWYSVGDAEQAETC
jgi:hypothetical protein